MSASGTRLRRRGSLRVARCRLRAPRAARCPSGTVRAPTLGALVLAWALFPVAGPACAQQPSGKPPLSTEVRRLLEEKGVDGTRQELPMLVMTARDTHEFDVDGMVALGREYLEAGDAEAAVAVLNLALLMDMQSAEANVALAEAYLAQGTPSLATMYYQQALANDPQNEPARQGLLALGEELPETREEREARREAERRRQEAEVASIDWDRGERRDDVESFTGRYADPNREVEHWVFFVAETCAGSGYLMTSGEWGDVAPWVLRSETETGFGQVAAYPGQEPMHFEFELGPDGVPTAVVMTGLYDEPTRLERLGPLGDGWQPAGEDCRIDAPGG